MAVQDAVARGNSMSAVRLLDRWFYFGMALVIALIVSYGFGHTVESNLIHPAIPRPPVLYVHATLFVIWVGIFIAQSSLVRSRNILWHRRLGLSAAFFGVLMIISGVAVAIAMRKFDIAHNPRSEPEFLIIPFYDMIAFASLLGLAIHWRKKPEFHRRLMLIATCGLLVAAFSRFPQTHAFWQTYAAVDLLIGLGMVRDLIVLRRVHPVYLYTLPVLVAGQALALMLYSYPPSWWSALSRALVA
jgi:hypothetical protein